MDRDQRLPASIRRDAQGLRGHSRAQRLLIIHDCSYQVSADFKKFAFPPSRSWTIAFGSLVHRTLDDLHEHLIARKESLHG